MTKDEIEQRLEEFVQKPRAEHDEVDRLIGHTIDTFRDYPLTSLKEYSALFWDSWTWETGDDRERVVAMTLQWMVERRENSEKRHADSERAFRKKVLEGVPFKMSVTWT